MVYIYKKQKGDKTYYYLRASVRKGDTIQTKDLAYLGDDPRQILEKLKALPAQYAEKIRKSYKTISRFLEANYALEKIQEQKLRTDPFLGQELTEKVEACKLHYEKTFSLLDEQTKQETLKNFVIEFAFNTTSIEGNTITLKEAEKLLMEQKTPKNKTLREVYDVQNTEQTFFTLYNAVPVETTHELIQDIHRQLLRNVDERTGYRTQEIRVYKSHFDSSPAAYVQTDMQLLLDWYHAQTLHPFVSAVLFHHKFEKIHPFMDGNGRTGRMLMNMLLLRCGYPPLIISKKQREKYIGALGKADKAGLQDAGEDAYAPLVRFAAEEYVRNYWNTFL